MKKKIVFLPYDFDTAIGINNEGALVFSYNLEDIDQTEGGADVFNGQQSVLWKNMRAAFFDEMKAMYQNLRSTGALSYEKVERMFEEHQAKWPEAIFNEDAWYKYLAPLVEKGNASYLSMLQGSKAEQRKWWLYNRFRYIDSKYNAGDALTDVITVRGYAKADITVRPYADVYASIKYGSYLVQARAARNHTYTLPCPLDNVNDTEIYIYSASQLADVGDLSGLMVGYADFSKAVKLQALKIGDADASYRNGNLTELYLGNNELLRSIDVRNCPALTQAVDLSGCANIEHVYFDGTGITGLSLPNGGILKTLHLPQSLTNLTIRNQTGITDFQMPSYENISTFRLENVSSVIEPLDILREISSGSRVRILGFSFNAEDSDEVREFIELLDTMRGLDENGGNVEKAQVAGTIHVESITGAELADYAQRYPDIQITFDHITSKLYYYNYEGDTLLYTESVADGGNGVYTGSPSHSSTAQYTFTFAGWSSKPNSTVADAAARTHVTADRRVYAAYRLTVRTYAVHYYVDNTLVYTASNVPYGSNAQYVGETPVKTGVDTPEDYIFMGWNPEPKNITGAMSVYALFRYTGFVSLRLVERTLEGEYVNNRITSIPVRAFWKLSKITKLTFANVKSCANQAFYDCNRLTSVDLPECETITGYTFQSTPALTSINLPKLKSTDSYAFLGSNLTSIDLPSIETMGGSSFSGLNNLISVTLGENLTTIPGNCFNGCTSLQELTIPAKVERVEDFVVTMASKLKSITFKGKPTYVSRLAFVNTNSLTDIYVPWEEGEVASAPWGASNATIHYGSTGNV